MIVVVMTGLTGCGSSDVRTTILERISSPDGKVEALIVRPDEGATGGTAEIVEVLGKGEDPAEAAEVLSWEPATEGSDVKISWDGPRRLRIKLTLAGSIHNFSNLQQIHVNGKDDSVSVRLDAPFYGDEPDVEAAHRRP